MVDRAFCVILREDIFLDCFATFVIALGVAFLVEYLYFLFISLLLLNSRSFFPADLSIFFLIQIRRVGVLNG